MATQQEKFMSKLKAEPLVPIGCLVTAGVLIGGIVNFKRGNVVRSQQMMRLRVAAQAATLGALAYGAYVSARDRTDYDDSSYQGNISSLPTKSENN